MPIRPEFRRFYTGPAWRAARAAVLARAGNRCEQCGKPNGARIIVVRLPLLAGAGFNPKPRHVQFWLHLVKGLGRVWIRCMDRAAFPKSIINRAFRSDVRKTAKQITVVLTIAHLNHTPGDDRPENLRALCQWCHLNLDKNHHHETRADRKDRARPLLKGAVL